jgi:hypothetical protein
VKIVESRLAQAALYLTACLMLATLSSVMQGQTMLGDPTVQPQTPTSSSAPPPAEPKVARPQKQNIFLRSYKLVYGHPLTPVSEPARVEIFGAYSRWYPYSQVNGQQIINADYPPPTTPYPPVNGLPLFPLKNGVVASATYYNYRNVGLELEGSYYQQTTNDGRRGGAIGPVYRFILPDITLRLHALGGADRFLGPIIPGTTNGGSFANPPVWAFIGTLGSSVDVEIPRTCGHFEVRLQADYQYISASYGPDYTSNSGRLNINSYRIAPGLVFRFGNIKETAKQVQR